jgi:hypothetical protein
MIGLPALLINLGFLLVPCLTGWIVYKDWRSQKTSKNIVVLVFVSLFFLTFSNRFLFNLKYYCELRFMAPQQISSIEVDGKSISNPNEVATLANGFNDIQWFSYNHGGTAKPVMVTVHYKSGREGKYAVKFYRRETGAVIEFGRRFENGAFISYGEAFCRQLPKAFQDVGMPLPTED